MNNHQILVPVDGQHLHLDQESEMHYWTWRFGCTESHLRSIVEQVGYDVDDVEEALNRALV